MGCGASSEAMRPDETVAEYQSRRMWEHMTKMNNLGEQNTYFLHTKMYCNGG